MAVGELAVNVTARTAKANKNITGFRKNVRKTGPAVDFLSGKMKGLAAGLAGFVAFRSLKHGVQSALDSIDKLAKTSRKLSIPTDELAGLRRAGELTGVTADVIDKSLQRMVINVSDAAAGFGEAKRELKLLGVDLQQLNAMSPDQQFRTIAEAINRIPNPANQARIAYKLFGKQGVSLLNTLRLGRKGLDDAAAGARRFGEAVSTADASKVEAANDALRDAKAAVGGLVNRIAVGLAPTIEVVSVKFTEWITTGDRATSVIGTGAKYIAKGLGVVADVVHTVRMAFKGLQVLVTKVIAVQVRQFDNLQKAIVAVINKIPGVDVKASSFVTTLAEDLERSASKGAADLREMFLADPPSVGINKFFDDIEERSKKAGERINKNLSPDPKMLAATSSGAKQIGQFLGKGLNLLAGAKQAALGAAVSGVASLAGPKLTGEAGINRALDARSAEGMAALRANQRSGGTQRTSEKAAVKTEENTNKTNVLLGRLVELVKNAPTLSIPSA